MHENIGKIRKKVLPNVLHRMSLRIPSQLYMNEACNAEIDEKNDILPDILEDQNKNNENVELPLAIATNVSNFNWKSTFHKIHRLKSYAEVKEEIFRISLPQINLNSKL